MSIEPLYGGKQSRRITTSDLIDAKSRGEKWPMITSYDALSASIFDEAGIGRTFNALRYPSYGSYRFDATVCSSNGRL